MPTSSRTTNYVPMVQHKRVTSLSLSAIGLTSQDKIGERHTLILNLQSFEISEQICLITEGDQKDGMNHWKLPPFPHGHPREAYLTHFRRSWLFGRIVFHNFSYFHRARFQHIFKSSNNHLLLKGCVILSYRRIHKDFRQTVDVACNSGVMLWSPVCYAYTHARN